jgi:hypothetical protein
VTGKTTALRSGLAVVGAYPDRFFNRGTKEKYLELCCESTIPIGIDDSSIQKDIDSSPAGFPLIGLITLSIMAFL